MRDLKVFIEQNTLVVVNIQKHDSSIDETDHQERLYPFFSSP